MGKWPRPGTGQPQRPEPAKSDCGDCRGFGGQYETNQQTGQKRWVDCESCSGSGKRGN